MPGSRLINRVPVGQHAIAFNPFSWYGLEDKRDKLRQLAHQVVNLQNIADEYAEQNGLSKVGNVVSSIRTGQGETPFLQAANAHLELSKLQQELVWEEGLDFDFVRKEYASILNPSSAELGLCERNINKAKSVFAKNKF